MCYKTGGCLLSLASPSLSVLVYSSWDCTVAGQYCTVQRTPDLIITQSVNIPNYHNYLPLGTGSQGKTNVSLLHYSVRRGGIVQIDDINILIRFTYFNVTTSPPPPPLPPQLMRLPLQPSDLNFCFQVCIDFLLCGWQIGETTTTTHTPCMKSSEQGRPVYITFYFTFCQVTDIHPWGISCKLSSYKQSANYLKSTYCSINIKYTREHEILQSWEAG